MTEYFKDIEQARNITEIREILYLITKKYSKTFTSIYVLLDAYQGKHRQVGQRFKTLKEAILKELRIVFVKKSYMNDYH